MKEITGNKVTNAGKNGIDVEKSSVQKIEKNVVSKTKTTGIFIYNTSSCKLILENTVSNIGNQGISINTKSSVVKISKNIIDKCKAYGITFGMQSKGNEISKNKIMVTSNLLLSKSLFYKFIGCSFGLQDLLHRRVCDHLMCLHGSLYQLRYLQKPDLSL